jgi:hypothetical protein
MGCGFFKTKNNPVIGINLVYGNICYIMQILKQTNESLGYT